MPEAALAPIQARLLSVATELFAEKGFDATSVQEVVERAQVTKGAPLLRRQSTQWQCVTLSGRPVAS